MYTLNANLHVFQVQDVCGRWCVSAAGPTVDLSVVPMVHKMSAVIRGDVFSNSGLAPKLPDVARDVYIRSVHCC